MGVIALDSLQVRVLECGRVFEAEAQQSIRADVPQQDDAREQKHVRLEKVSGEDQRDGRHVEVHQVVDPGARAKAAQIAQHREIGRKEEQEIHPPCSIRCAEQENGHHEHSQTFQRSK